jgi:hypothetical protein
MRGEEKKELVESQRKLRDNKISCKKKKKNVEKENEKILSKRKNNYFVKITTFVVFFVLFLLFSVLNG